MDYGMYWHCSVHINYTHVILMGGRENGFRPYIFNLNNFEELFYGSELSFTRKGCAASQIIHENGTVFIIIVGPDDTTEMLNTNDIFGKWAKGEIKILYKHISHLKDKGAGKLCQNLLKDQFYLKNVLMVPWSVHQMAKRLF